MYEINLLDNSVESIGNSNLETILVYFLGRVSHLSRSI